jgi:hypothetical protein
LRGKPDRSFETAAGRAWKNAGGDSMKYRVLFSFLLTVLFVVASGCGSVKNCPVCGTTTADGYTNIDVILVPEHNPTGEPGGPFNSFDISVVDPVSHRFFVSDRVGLDVAVIDTNTDIAVNAIEGVNGVAAAGNLASPCAKDGAGNDIIPPMLTAFGNFTRYGCRTKIPGGVTFTIPTFGANHLFGGFPGAQCCAARSNGVNPLSAPDGEALTADGKTLFVANGSSSVVVFDLTTNTPANPPTVIATVPTGQSGDYDGGPNPGIANSTGIAGCIASANGRAFSDPTCGDLRADEMSWDEKDKILLVANGDPGLPFVTLIDMSAVVARTAVGARDPHCLPVNPKQAYGPTNFPTCILGQIYYDNALPVDNTVAVDSGNGFACPDPSLAFFGGASVPSGVSGTGVGAGGANVPCHHGPVLSFAGAPFGAFAVAGIGGSAFNPNTGHFLVTNSNATPDLTVGTVDEIDPGIGTAHGPIVVNSFIMPNCMPTSVVQGPGDNFLVGCADHDGEAFPPNEYVINGTTGAIIATIDNVGGVDEVWYNPGDNRYYLAARDMPAGPVMGVIDARTNQWLVNVTTNSNSHSIAVDPSNNHVFVPLQAGGICTTQTANGCIGVYAQQ